jgi:myo-inositol-1(or 4)-monophosphatase
VLENIKVKTPNLSLSRKEIGVKEELDIAIQAAKEAGKIVMAYYRSNYDVRDKSPNNPVTTADLAANRQIREIIRHAFPDDGWLSEETKDSPDRLAKSRVWVIDPIDGTEEFIEGLPEFAVSIAFVIDGTEEFIEGLPEFAVSIAFVIDGAPIVGVLHNPATAEFFYAKAGTGAFCNGKPIHCSSCETLEKASMLVSQTEHRKGLLAGLISLVSEIRYIGSVAYKLGRLAAGTSDLYITVRPKNEWDFCAGDLILREAGGVLWDKAGQSMRYNKEIVKQPTGLFAGNATIVKKIIDAYRELIPVQV